MSNSSKKTPWHLRFAPGAILRQIGLAVLALTMLVGVQTAEAQSPDIQFYGVYGVDTYYELGYYNGQWHEFVTELNQIQRPRARGFKGYASYRHESPLQCGPPGGGNRTAFSKRIIKRTLWYHDDTHRNKEDYEDYCRGGQIQRSDYLVANTNNVPVLYLSNKAMIVGRIETVLSSIAKNVDEHRTSVLLTATHTSGTKNFTVVTKYRIEGGANVVSHSQSVVLKPGQKKSISLFVPVGNWATIDSVTATQNRPYPVPPRAPPVFIAPVPVPKPVPVPAPPSNPNPNPRRPRR